jgi:hypothetical protein
MATLSPYVIQQYFDDNGDPLADGKVYTYEAGTDTPKSVYTTQAGDVPHSNPVILDSAGRATIWVGSGAYKFKITDSNDSILDTVDDINQSSQTSQQFFETITDLRAIDDGSVDLAYVEGYAAEGDGGGGWFYWDANSAANDDGGAVIKPTGYVGNGRFIRIVDGNDINVRWFGATGDGITNDTTTINKADAYADSVSKNTLIPQGSFLVNASLSLAAPMRFAVNGELKWTVSMNPNITPIIDENDFSQHFNLGDPAYAPNFNAGCTVKPQWFGAVGDGSTNDSEAFEAAGVSINANGGTIHIPAVATGYVLGYQSPTAPIITLTDNMTIRGDGNASKIIMSDAVGSDNIFAGNTSIAYRVRITGISFNGQDAVSSNGLFVDAIISDGEISNCNVYSVVTAAIDGDFTDVNIFGNTFSSVTTAAIKLTNADNVQIYDNNFIQASVGTGINITAGTNKTVDHVTVKNNTFVDSIVNINASASGATKDSINVIGNKFEITADATTAVTIHTLDNVAINGNAIISTFADNTGSAVSETSCTNVVYGFNRVSGYANSTDQSRTVVVSERLGLKKSATVTAANNLTLGKGTVNITTGSTAINLISNIGWSDGGIAIIKFGAAVTVNHNEATSSTNITIQLDGSADMSAIAGDVLVLRYDANGGGAGVPQWIEINRVLYTNRNIRTGIQEIATSGNISDARITANTKIFLQIVGVSSNGQIAQVDSVSVGSHVAVSVYPAATKNVSYMFID